MKSTSFNKILRHPWFWLLILVLLSSYSITLGVKNFSLVGMLSGNQNDINLAIISRIPRLISIIITGASLSIAGLIMQTMTQNRFVSPSTAGTMEWCRLGIMFAMLLFANATTLHKMVVAFITSILGTLFFMKILKTLKFKNAVLVPLVGLMLGSVVSAITSYFAYRFDMVQNMSSWMQGNFSLVMKGRYELIYIGIPFLIIAYFYANKFTIAGMGESFAKNLGLNHKWVVSLGLVIVAIITSTVVVTIGTIPFIGLIIPNLVAMRRGDNLRNSLPITAIFGSLFLLLCDILGRVIIFPYEVPISVIVSIVGSVLFLIILYRRSRHG